jgi:hypothetical protein
MIQQLCTKTFSMIRANSNSQFFISQYLVSLRQKKYSVSLTTKLFLKNSYEIIVDLQIMMSLLCKLVVLSIFEVSEIKLYDKTK